MLLSADVGYLWRRGGEYEELEGRENEFPSRLDEKYHRDRVKTTF